MEACVVCVVWRCVEACVVWRRVWCVWYGGVCGVCVVR